MSPIYAMGKLTVLDGDFKLQLRRHLNPTERLNPDFAIEALKYNQHAVYKTHLDYLRAGAQIIRTNTYLAPSRTIAMTDYMTLLKQAVRSARQAIFKYYEEEDADCFNIDTFHANRHLLAGTCNGYSVLDDTFQHLMNSRTLNILRQFYETQVAQILCAKVDLLAFESVASMVETEAIIDVLKKYPDIRAMITFLCQDGKLIDGSTFAYIAAYIKNCLPTQIIAIGANCSVPNSTKTLMRNINNGRDSKIPFMFYADHHSLLSKAGTDEFAVEQQYNIMQEYIDIGVRFVGGCYNTEAEDIKMLTQQVQNYYLFRDDLAASVNACSYRNVRTKSKI